MKLKGDYNSLTQYDVGDLVRYTDHEIYHLFAPCKAGITPIDTHYWNRADQGTALCAKIALDAIDLAKAAALVDVAALIGTVPTGKTVEEQITELAGSIPTNISNEAITLTGTGEAEYLITVDDSGETPELDVTLIEPETPDEPAAEEET